MREPGVGWTLDGMPGLPGGPFMDEGSPPLRSTSLFRLPLGYWGGRLKRASSAGGRTYSSGFLGGLVTGLVEVQPAKASSASDHRLSPSHSLRMGILPDDDEG